MTGLPTAASCLLGAMVALADAPKAADKAEKGQSKAKGKTQTKKSKSKKDSAPKETK